MSSPFCKNISLSPSGKSSLGIGASRSRKRGVGHRQERWEGDAVDAIASARKRRRRAGPPVSDRPARRRTALLRTAKSCGPGTRCWCQVGGGALAQPGLNKPLIRRRRWQKEFVTGESAKETVKTIAQGRPGESGGPVVTTLVCSLHIAREAAGAARIRLSLRPLFLRGGKRSLHSSGASRREIEDARQIFPSVIAREGGRSSTPGNQ